MVRKSSVEIEIRIVLYNSLEPANSGNFEAGPIKAATHYMGIQHNNSKYAMYKKLANIIFLKE